MFKLNNKGASEVIVVIMIVMVTVVLATMFFAWLKESSSSRLNETGDEVKQASDFSCMNDPIIVESCTITDSPREISLVLSNNSDLKIFNIVLSVNGKDVLENNLNISGRFDTVINSGQVIQLTTDSNFTYITGDETDFGNIVIGTINNTTLTNGTCPKKIINLNCESE